MIHYRHYFSAFCPLKALFIFALTASMLCYTAPAFAEDEDIDTSFSDMGTDTTPGTDTIADPLEPFNRGVLAFNHIIDRFFAKPVAKTYRFIVPTKGREMIGNALNNIGEPTHAVNAFFQGDIDQGFQSSWRFILNSTIGMGGVFDVAAEAGLNKRQEDFGQTMGYYGAGHGFYLMLPIFGPSSVRDGAGKIVDAFTNPMTYSESEEAQIAYRVLSGIHTRYELLGLMEDVEATSFDPYAAYKSLYVQYRAHQVQNTR
ncbi:MAG: hypothetical protein K0R63_1036 [Rickettsiales bacterium]|jgi:phospholipid-binding lipoprotein MlaA|nr:hypothetical protein [Rickettsiales bacterium]